MEGHPVLTAIVQGCFCYMTLSSSAFVSKPRPAVSRNYLSGRGSGRGFPFLTAAPMFCCWSSQKRALAAAHWSSRLCSVPQFLGRSGCLVWISEKLGSKTWGLQYKMESPHPCHSMPGWGISEHWIWPRAAVWRPLECLVLWRQRWRLQS